VLSGEKILITGPAGQIAFPMAASLAADNEVWGLARFSEAGSRQRVEDTGIRTVVCDLAGGDLDGVPQDFTVVLHLAAYQGPDLDYDHAIKVNAEATGLILQHCRTARAALVMSTHSVYRPWDDPMHVFLETDPLGDVHSTHCPTYSVSKIGQEAVARFCARAFDLPVVIARMNASFGPEGGLPALHADAVARGENIVTRWDPCPYSPIHQTDINDQTEALIDAAGVPALIVNWAGDEPVTVQEWGAEIERISGRPVTVEARPIEGTLRGSIADNTLRKSITGPCRVDWREGLRETWEARHGAAASTA